MRAIVGFLHFWYDFIVGEAWEVAAGALAVLVIAWLLTHLGLSGLAWLLLPVGIMLALTGSLAWAARGA